MFHVDWLDSAGNSFYKKRIDISPADSITSITSSISISPQKRQTGKYSVRVYLFQRINCRKDIFTLLNQSTDSNKCQKKGII